jgi:hypothetical protein
VAGRAARSLSLRAAAARLPGLVRGGRSHAGEARPPALAPAATITLRFANPGEEAAIERLAELSGRVAAPGGYLVAEVDGQLWAALPVGGGEAVADPFLPAREVKALLALRATQLDAVITGGERLLVGLENGEQRQLHPVGCPQPHIPV